MGIFFRCRQEMLWNFGFPGSWILNQINLDGNKHCNINKQQPLTEVKTTDNQRTKHDPKKRGVCSSMLYFVSGWCLHPRKEILQLEHPFKIKTIDVCTSNTQSSKCWFFPRFFSELPMFACNCPHILYMCLYFFLLGATTMYFVYHVWCFVDRGIVLWLNVIVPLNSPCHLRTGGLGLFDSWILNISKLILYSPLAGHILDVNIFLNTGHRSPQKYLSNYISCIID